LYFITNIIINLYNEMKLFCKHNWILIKETYKPAPIDKFIDRIKDKVSLSPWCFEDTTTFIWKCSKCKKLRISEVNGKTTL
jgi:hypothetical protein